MWPFTASESQQRTQEASPSSSACPVDHTTREKWVREQQQQQQGGAAAGPSNAASSAQVASRKLSSDRVVSSIPRWLANAPEASSPTPPPANAEGCPSHLSGSSSSSPTTPPASPPSPPSESNWVYPSPSQFHAALLRKGRSTAAESASMDIVVPIHNAVNERCWEEILQWEKQDAGDEGRKSWRRCGGPKLVSFQGRPKDVTWKAWGRGFLGYQPPFDRHDWIVDRCGHRVRYIIDFYAGRGAGGGNPFASPAPSGGAGGAGGAGQQPLSFYLDVRPAPDTLEGLTMRARRLFGLGTQPAGSEGEKAAAA